MKSDIHVAIGVSALEVALRHLCVARREKRADRPYFDALTKEIKALAEPLLRLRGWNALSFL